MQSEHPNLIKAILKTKADLPSLAKGDRNQHGNYSYVSIDKFYEGVASKASENGITWRIREESCEPFSAPTNRGEQLCFKTVYVVDVMHVSGEEAPGFFRATVIHPFQGAQTAGSSLSYFDKLFMRTTFSVVTGEQDADATDNTVFSAGSTGSGGRGPQAEADAFSGLGEPAEKPAARRPRVATGRDPGPVRDATPSVTEDASAVIGELSRDETALIAADLASMVETFLPAAKTHDQLTRFWTANETAFNEIKKSDKPAFDKMVEAFKARRNELKQGDEA